MMHAKLTWQQQRHSELGLKLELFPVFIVQLSNDEWGVVREREREIEKKTGLRCNISKNNGRIVNEKSDMMIVRSMR